MPGAFTCLCYLIFITDEEAEAEILWLLYDGRARTRIQTFWLLSPGALSLVAVPEFCSPPFLSLLNLISSRLSHLGENLFSTLDLSLSASFIFSMGLFHLHFVCIAIA